MPIDQVNVDTDQIIPKQFLKLIGKTGYGQYLFYDWRFQPNSGTKGDFVLNQPRYKGATILLARANFGCGSSREHAAWALKDYGFRVLIAPSYADIFYNNSFKNGLLPIALDDTTVNQLFEEVARQEGYYLNVDLENQRIRKPNDESIHFQIEKFRKQCLLEGLDDISLTMKHEEKIRSYEQKLRPFQLIQGSR